MFGELLVKVARELDSLSVPYMVIGGQAVLLYGEPRITRDIDVTLGIDIDEVDKIKQVIRNLQLRILPKQADDFVKDTRALPVVEESSGVRVDFVFSFIAFERQAIQRAIKVKVGGYPVSYVSLEDILIYKLVSGRAIDIEDVKNILRKNPVYDRDYVLKWLHDFEEILGKQLTKSFQDIFGSEK